MHVNLPMIPNTDMKTDKYSFATKPSRWRISPCLFFILPFNRFYVIFHQHHWWCLSYTKHVLLLQLVLFCMSLILLLYLLLLISTFANIFRYSHGSWHLIPQVGLLAGSWHSVRFFFTVIYNMIRKFIQGCKGVSTLFALK